jgi:hypothetical protein
MFTSAQTCFRKHVGMKVSKWMEDECQCVKKWRASFLKILVSLDCILLLPLSSIITDKTVVSSDCIPAASMKAQRSPTMLPQQHKTDDHNRTR